MSYHFESGDTVTTEITLETLLLQVPGQAAIESAIKHVERVAAGDGSELFKLYDIAEEQAERRNKKGPPAGDDLVRHYTMESLPGGWRVSVNGHLLPWRFKTKGHASAVIDACHRNDDIAFTYMVDMIAIRRMSKSDLEARKKYKDDLHALALAVEIYFYAGKHVQRIYDKALADQKIDTTDFKTLSENIEVRAESRAYAKMLVTVLVRSGVPEVVLRNCIHNAQINDSIPEDLKTYTPQDA